MRRLLFFVFAVVLFVSGVQAVSFMFSEKMMDEGGVIVNEEMVRSSSVTYQIITENKVVCRFSSSSGKDFELMEGLFDYNFETIHKESITDLVDGVYRFYVRCREGENVSEELETVFKVNAPVSAQIILPEEDPLKDGKYELEVITSKVLPRAPTISYSFDGESYKKIPMTGKGTDWKGYLIIPETTGEAVGSFKFSGRDLEGVLGDEITEGDVFLIDTSRPETITDIKATGGEGLIELKWIFEEEVEGFNIYKSTSPKVEHIDFYKFVEEKELLDLGVEKGRTYYYRVAGVDSAGNEGDLSREVYATALLENTSVSSSGGGLALELLGFVDNFLSEVDLKISEIGEIKERFLEKDGKEKEIYEGLKLEREINTAVNELNSLKREAGNYKTQSLSKSELDRKLNSARLKLSSIKRKVPESVSVVSENKIEETIDEEDLRRVILELEPGVLGGSVDDRARLSLESIKERGFGVSREGYNVEVVYMDGTSDETSLVRSVVEGVEGEDESLSIIEFVPRSIAESVSELDIKNVDYEVLKEDLIISFSSSIREISYSIDGHIDLDSIDEIETVLLRDGNVEDGEAGASLTGYFSFVESGEGAGYFIFIVGILAVAGLTGYLFFLKRAQSGELVAFSDKVFEAKAYLKGGDLIKGKEIFKSLSEDYRNLKKRDKRQAFILMEGLSKEIHNAYFKKKFEDVNFNLGRDKERARLMFKSLSEIYGRLDGDFKSSVREEYERLREALR